MSIDKFDADYFIGKAKIIDLSNTSSQSIGIKSLIKYESSIEDLDYLILKTGWSKYWGDNNYFEGFPTLSTDAAEWVLKHNLRGIGIDAMSVDPIEAKTFPVHHILFKKDFIIIENMANLDEVGDEQFLLSCLPLKLKDADGSPVRAVAIIM